MLQQKKEVLLIIQPTSTHARVRDRSQNSIPTHRGALLFGVVHPLPISNGSSPVTSHILLEHFQTALDELHVTLPHKQSLLIEWR